MCETNFDILYRFSIIIDLPYYSNTLHWIEGRCEGVIAYCARMLNLVTTATTNYTARGAARYWYHPDPSHIPCVLYNLLVHCHEPSSTLQLIALPLSRIMVTVLI